MSVETSDPEALIPQFVFEQLLNQDSQGRRIILLGQIASQPALLLAERAAFSTTPTHLQRFTSSLSSVQNLGDNDIYRWYLARTSTGSDVAPSDPPPHDLKLNLIYPCTSKHIRKYTPQTLRYVTETPEIYARYVRPWIVQQREEGRLNWVFNILEGRTEQEDVLYRSWEHRAPGAGEEEVEKRFILLPDLNWDRKTVSALHLLALPERRDKWSVRDLGKGDVAWLEEMVGRLEAAVGELYGGEKGVESDMIKFYLHYQPTYYHMHIHIVALTLDAGATQAVGKALDLRNVIGMLKAMPDESSSMADVGLSYTVGEGAELWEKIWGPLKKGEKPSVGDGGA
ncbi:m7GpppX diphosphatase [Elsinoe australis]|uniref:M7GpppX diphosphatase n=1 Tax=Elsinoe australis TaxID=40998 RepID=A0A4U7AT62_9PEZI|nr:m7GpppX diphosphatase [Elsinoe australis]